MGPSDSLGADDVPHRKSLPHDVPLWVDPQKEIYFISANCEERARNQLALPDVAPAIFDTVRHRHELRLWWPHLFLVMPDHVHALMSFPPSDKPIKLIVKKWKEWTAKQLGIRLAAGFFRAPAATRGKPETEGRLHTPESCAQRIGKPARGLALRLFCERPMPGVHRLK
jgi:hypothetical protein